MDKIRFSVVLPVFNSINTIESTLNSVLNQTYEYFEIIIIDDGSTDGTGDFIKLKFEDKRIKYFKINNSGGPANPRNIGISNSIYDWIAFIDSDDIWVINKLEVVAQNIVNNIDFVAFCHDEYLVDKRNPIMKILKYGPYESDFYKILLLYGNRCSTSATVVFKPFLLKYNILFDISPEMTIVEDYDFWLKIARYEGKFFFFKGYFRVL